MAAVDGPALEMYTCGVCGFAHDVYGESPRCKLIVAEQTREWVDTGEDRDVASPFGDDDQVRDWLDGEAGSEDQGP